MTKKVLLKVKNVLILSLIILVIAGGCKKKETEATEEEPTAPTLPPQTSMKMDMSDFGGTKSLKYYDYKSINDTTMKNYNASAIAVGLWNLAVTAGMAVPIASFVAAINQKPVYQGNMKWLFSYSFPHANSTYTAKLTAEKITTGINWEMKVTRSGYFTDYLWYKGFSNTGNTKGNWTIYADTIKTNNVSGKYVNSIPMIDIAWNNNGTVADIKYTNVVPAGKENGGYITYGVNTKSPFNAYYYIFNKGLNNLTSIEWNRTNKSGHAKDAIFFKDTLWHCWNNNKFDQICN